MGCKSKRESDRTGTRVTLVQEESSASNSNSQNTEMQTDTCILRRDDYHRQ